MLRLGIDPEKLYRATSICQDGLCCCNMALISFRLFHKNLGNLRDVFGQVVYRPPWQKISRTPMCNTCSATHKVIPRFISQSGEERKIFFRQDSEQILLEICNELFKQRPFPNSYIFINLGSSRVSDKIALVSAQNQNK